MAEDVTAAVRRLLQTKQMKKEGKITNCSAVVISGTVIFFKSQVKGIILSWCEEYSLTSRVLLCVARLVSKEHLF